MGRALLILLVVLLLLAVGFLVLYGMVEAPASHDDHAGHTHASGETGFTDDDALRAENDQLRDQIEAMRAQIEAAEAALEQADR